VSVVSFKSSSPFKSVSVPLVPLLVVPLLVVPLLVVPLLVVPLLVVPLLVVPLLLFKFGSVAYTLFILKVSATNKTIDTKQINNLFIIIPPSFILFAKLSNLLKKSQKIKNTCYYFIFVL
jgi:hypothetical protein